MAMTEKKAKRIVDDITASFAMESMICTEEQKQIVFKIIMGESKVEDVISDLDKKYKEHTV